MESGGNRWRQSLTEDRNHNHLRDLLRVRQDDHGNGLNVPGLTLGSVLNADKRSSSVVQSNRTLLDIIREDSTKDNKKTWKHFKDKLRLRRAGAAWTSSVHIPVSDAPMQPNNNSSSNRMMMRRHSTRFPTADGGPEYTHPNTESTQPELSELTRGEQNPAPNRTAMLQRSESCRSHSNQAVTSENNTATEEQRETPSTEEEGEGTGEGEGAPVRMSLMSLLAETDRQMGLDGSTAAYMMGDEEEEEEEETGGRNVGGGGEYNNCCVCMVRHKGAAFIPCGHTFCRLCSRELWVQRGNCPLCNGYILEILDIF